MQENFYIINRDFKQSHQKWLKSKIVEKKLNF